MSDELDPRHDERRAAERDELDRLLRTWHGESTRRAAAGRDGLLARLRAGDLESPATRRRLATRNGRMQASTTGPASVIPHIVRSVLMNRYTPAAASLALLVALIAVLAPFGERSVVAAEIMVPDGGRLEALDDTGALVGPCPLEHTDVHAEISGRFARVTLVQRYRNPYEQPIEAVYTFPLSHQAGVDRMTMTIGDRVVVGTVKERQEARRVYETARAAGYVASLLEQERPNIFTQSVANVAPGAEVLIEISYVELVRSTDGLFSFEFPMVVGPRYVPGRPAVTRRLVPAELTPRAGVVLRGPAQVTIGEPGDVSTLGTLQAGRLHMLLEAASPIEPPDQGWWGEGEATASQWYSFFVTYCDGSTELGQIHVDGTGLLNGRWFFTDPKLAADAGTGSAPDTDQVPDASRITPLPVRPPKRAGHDISISVSIDTGGPALRSIEAPLHEISGAAPLADRDVDRSRLTVELAAKREIPNRDFVLRWRQADDRIETAQFAHTGEHGKFFTVMIEPPARVADVEVPPRELIFVLDTSGSMSGFPIEKAKAVMTRAIDAMRDGDTFNVVTFAGHTSVLWDEPRPATAANRTAARSFVESRQGGGGTEMMTAIETALRPTATGKLPAALTPAELADLPADGRSVVVRVDAASMVTLDQDGAAPSLVEFEVREDLRLRARIATWTLTKGPIEPDAAGRTLVLRGTWHTEDGRRVLAVDHGTDDSDGAGDGRRTRLVVFLTDGFVGNDDQIIAAVRRYAGTTRVFSFGIGNSVNRHLLDGMALSGRGAAEFVLLADDADAAVERFTRRIETPVLTDVVVTLAGDLEISDTIPPLDALPDLFDAAPIVVHGRYAAAGRGTLTISGRTGAGRWERVVPIELPEHAPDHDTVATMWARARVDQLERTDDREAVVALGTQFQIMTSHTSFVAVEHSRVVVEGQAMLVPVPVELPDGVAWEGIFGASPQLDTQAAAGVTLGAAQLQPLPQVAAPGSGGGFGGGGGSGGGGGQMYFYTAQQQQQQQSFASSPSAYRVSIPQGTNHAKGAVLTTAGAGRTPVLAEAFTVQAGTTRGLAVDSALGLDSLGSGSYRINAAGMPELFGQPTPTGDTAVRLHDVRDLLAVELETLAAACAVVAGRPLVGADQASLLVALVDAAAPDAETSPPTARAALVVQGGILQVMTSAEHHEAVEAALERLRDEQPLRTRLEDLARERKLAATLHETLRTLIDDPSRPVPATMTTVDGDRLLVSVLATDLETATLDAFAAAGLHVLDQVGSRSHVVGSIERGNLAALAGLKEVRRVEPILK